MKTLGKILILLFAWCVLTGITYPVSRTSWADGVRVMVREARAKRMMKMREQTVNPNENRTESTREGMKAGTREAAEPSEAGKTSETCKPSEAGKKFSGARAHDSQGRPEAAGQKPGPHIKAPNLSLAGLAEIRIFAMFALIPAILTVWTLRIMQTKRP